MKYTMFILSLIAVPVYSQEAALALGHETIVVIGKRPATEYATDLAGSVDVVTRDQLEHEHVKDTLELFNKIPGVYLSRFNQGIINTDIAIRGFAGEGSTPHSKLLIDGVPANLHSGYGELDQLFPLGIESIQVFKGTSDPRYGLYNLAGNYQVLTRHDNANKLEGTLGSYDTRELQTFFGKENDRLQQSYFIGYRESGGYRDHTDLEKYSVSGRWSYDFAPDHSLSLIARQAGYDGDAPGYLSKEQAEEDPTASAAYANQDGGNKTTRHLSLHLDNEISPSLSWQFKTYGQYFQRERWVRFSEASALQNRYEEQDHYGALTHLQWKITEDWAVNAGADYEKQDILEQRFGTVGQRRARNTSNILRNFDYDFVSQGAYIQLLHSPSDFLGWNIAMRADKLDGDFLQRAANGAVTPRKMYDFGTITQPKFNLFWMPVDQITFFAHYGRSFQQPFGADAYTAGDIQARDVSINDGTEAGLSWGMSSDFTIRVSYWEQSAKEEFVVVDGAPQNVGRTNRRGFDAGLNWKISQDLYFWANYATVDARISGASIDAGNQLRSIPNYTSSFGMEYSITSKFLARMHLDGQGDYYVNEANVGGTFGEYTLLGMSFDYAMPWGNVNLQINNLADDYFEYVYDLVGDGQDTIHSPGSGRNISTSISYEF